MPEGSESLIAMLLARPIPPADRPLGPVASALYSRLLPEDIEELERRLEGVAEYFWDEADEQRRRRLAVLFTAYYAIWDALARTGLQHEMPPEDVHTMARGPLAAGGDPWIADIVLEAFGAAGFEVGSGDTVLDFGSSSGRVLRALAAWRPEVTWIGCDPNEPAIGWAQQHLRNMRFFVSPQAPPLELAAGSVDLAYAISIWSHFDVDAGLRWLDEMHRVIRPGGGLLITTHGLDTLSRFLRIDEITHEQAAAITHALLSTGFQYYDVFGEAGDWGVRDEAWGNAYLTPGWLLANVTPRWAVRRYEPGGLDQNQDIFVLERR